ncbi:transglutaminase-like domain-containing protein [Candidatus Amarolinea aalborgensis]|uniref:transglutaminase-like domain-containing protein n=1 Tax=Candidatus Amarolinea aalborgensis TaxID=2249329 RepID=UPI003BFA2CF3
MDRLLLWLIRRLRPREGWALLLLALAMACVLPIAIETAAWTRRPDSLWGLALWATLIGLWLSRRAWRGVSTLLVGGLLGAMLVANAIGQLLPPVWQALWEIVRSLVWSGQRVFTGAPFPHDLWLPLISQTVWRAQSFAIGLGATDASTTIFRLLLAALVWTTSAWLGFWLFRPAGSRLWVAVFPTGLVIAASAFFAGRQAAYVGGFLALLLVLLTVVHWRAQLRTWLQHGSDYPDDVAFDQTVAAAVLLAAALTAAALAPPIALRPVENAFWNLARPVWQPVEEAARAAFPGVIRPARSPLAGAAPSSGLPREELMGSGPDLAKRVLFRIAIDYQPVNAWTPYWKETTFAVYTGRGWALEEAERLTVLDMPAGRSWHDPGIRPDAGLPGVNIRQTVDWVGEGDWQVAVAVGEAQAVSAPYRAILRPGGDLVGLEFERPQRRVAVDSRATPVNTDLLRIVNKSTKNQQSNYLQIPSSLPARVATLARSITADAANPYDQALQIEAYLRTLTYDLDVPMVSPSADLVDAFLFDLRRGYCDYFASAFVMMARGVGLPARLAVGYASGRQEAPGVWLVSAADAHSWPEVYFEGVGWVAFEPTPARPLLVPLHQLPSNNPAVLAPRSALPLPLAGWTAAATLGAMGVWLLARGQRAPLSAAEICERLAQWGSQLGYRPAIGATLREFDQGLSAHLQRIETPRTIVATAEVRQVLHGISQACEASLYGGPAAALTAAQASDLWKRWQRTWWFRWRLTRSRRKF